MSKSTKNGAYFSKRAATWRQNRRKQMTVTNFIVRHMLSPTHAQQFSKQSPLVEKKGEDDTY
jgi:hypothetical protein